MEKMESPCPDLPLSLLGRPSPSNLQEVYTYRLAITLPAGWALESDCELWSSAKRLGDMLRAPGLPSGCLIHMFNA